MHIAPEKGSILLYIILGVILHLIIGGLFFYFYKSTLPTPPSSDTPIHRPTESPSPSPTPQNPMGQNAIIKADTTQKGPWNMNLYTATSTNGNLFTNIVLFEQRAGVVSAAKLPDGKLLTAFQWFPSNDPQNFDKVALKQSSDDGKTWSKPIPAKFMNYPEEYSRPFDPTLLVTKEGKVRMYFTVNTSLTPGPDMKTAFYSAISDDGITFTFEPNVRFGIKDTKLVDSAATIINGFYHLTAPVTDGSGAYHAVSLDGLTFTQTATIASTPDYNWTGNLVPFQDGFRFYGISKKGGKLFYSFSKDGQTWTTPTLTNLWGGDPAVVQTTDSHYLIFYTSKP